MNKKTVILICVILVSLVAAVTAGWFIYKGLRDGNTPEETKYVDIIKNGMSDYSIIYSSSDPYREDFDVAKELRARAEVIGVTLNYYSDSVQSQSAHEILIGSTNRALSGDLTAALEAKGETGGYAWIIAERDGKLAFVANCAEAYLYGAKDLYALIAEDGMTVAEKMYFEGVLTKEELEEMDNSEMQAYVDALKQMNTAFTEEQFGKESYIPMISEENGYYKVNPKPEPTVSPTSGEHPRYLLDRDGVERIKEILNDPYYANLCEAFWEFANAGPEEHLYGVFPEVKDYRFDSEILAMLEAKALAYLITGEERYALEAIIGIKNAILTFKYTATLHGDVYHGPSLLMITSAAIYDWCYDYLSESDKWQIIYAVATKLAPGLEQGMQYPPSGMTVVSGHGTGPQFLRDWMTVSLAFFDEVPDWWSFVGGRYFSEYLPVANEQFSGGWVSQGTVIYGQLKVHVQLWAAYLVKCATGATVLTDDARLTAYYELSHIRPDGRYFETGDGTRSRDGSPVGSAEFFVHAALFNDPVIYANAKYYCEDFTVFFYDEQGFDTILPIHPAYQLAFSSAVDYNGEDYRDGIETVQYFGGNASQLTAREKWDDPEAVTVMMKIGNRTMANHDLYDHGTFQIYYKGLLAATSGAYRGYGMPAHWYYHQATVAHNGLLIFNPAFADEEPIYDPDKPVTKRLENAHAYYYSGSQYLRSEAQTYDEWVSGKYDMAKTLGAASGYDKDGSPQYAYIAGDITNSYHEVTVDFVGRSMFTLFTGDEAYPALFFTFDQITSDSETFEKTWLLHVVNEPTVDADTKTATVVNGEGKMIVYSLSDADVMEAIGGKDKAYWINGYYKEDGTYVEGKNCTDDYTQYDYYDEIWGRIQLRSRGNKDTEFFTMMAITDTSNATPLTYEKIESDSAIGVKALGNIIMFARSEELNSKEITFTQAGEGSYQYYITGLESGKWRVTVNGTEITTVKAKRGESMITFTAPAGDVRITPLSDVAGSNGDKIQYNAQGATLPEDAPYYYSYDEATTLPTDVKRDNDVFLGWYTTPTFDEGTRITEIPAGTKGVVKVYAKWIYTFVDEDFSKSEIHAVEAREDENGVTYHGVSKAGASFITKTDENGVSYLEWLEGSADPLICQTSEVKNYASLAGDRKCVSMTFSLSLDKDAAPMVSHIRLIAKKNVDGDTISAAHTIFLNTDAEGRITAIDGWLLAQLSKDSITTVRILLDFDNGIIRYYGEDYSVLHDAPIIPPEATGAANAEELRKCLDEYVWYWYGCTPNDIDDAALRIYRIRVVEGDEFSDKQPEKTSGIEYHTGGAALPDGAPLDFADSGETPLPENMSLEGYYFGGWYTSGDYAENTRVSAVPEGTTGVFEVYALWYKVFTENDFENTDFDITETDKIVYDGELGFRVIPEGSSLKTVEETGGNKYVKVAVAGNDAIIILQNDEYNLTNMVSDTLYIEMELLPISGVNLTETLIKIATSGGAYGQLDIARVDPVTGDVKLAGGSTPFANILTQRAVIRLGVSFKEGKAYAYGEGGEVISESTLTVPTSQVQTLDEWRRVAKNYVLYVYLYRNGSSETQPAAIGVDNLSVKEGNQY